MTLNPNKYKARFDVISKLWLERLDKEDFEQTISEISIITGVEIAAVCMILEHLHGDTRIEPIRNKLIKFYKYDIVEPIFSETPWEKLKQINDSTDEPNQEICTHVGMKQQLANET